MIAVQSDGRIDLDDLVSKIDDKTVLVSVMYANNEVGTIQPLKDVAERINVARRKRAAVGNKLPLYLHTDACQAANYLDMHAARLGVDLMTINGGKVYGPKQSGALYLKAGTVITPLISGGGQERGLRSGTENVAGAVGLAAALNLAQENRPTEVSRLQKLRDDFMQRVETALPGASVNGSLKKRLPNNVHITFPEVDNERLLIQLDEAGIMAAAGSACSASKEASSHVLLAMGKTDQEARSSIRFTLGRDTQAEHITKTIDTLAKLLAQ
jgi:cysteine desulfurase